MAPLTVSRLRRRRLRRGAAATEGVVIATFFVFIFACMWGALTFHHEKIRVMREARAQAWLYALNACEGGGGTKSGGGSDVLGDLKANTDTSGGPTAENSQNEFANVEDSKLTKDSGYASVSVVGSVAMPGLIGGASYQPDGKMYMRCNEDPPPDNLLDIGKKAMTIIKGMFGF
jgi:hypothetical protein